MLRGIRRRIHSGLGLPPPDATVDPAAFPEAEYPVRCLECGYALQGLPDGRCPECGTSFKRGRLLVETYAFGRRPRRDPRYRLTRILWRITVVSYAIALLMMFFWWIALHVAPVPALELFFRVLPVLVLAWPGALLLALVTGVFVAVLDMRALPPAAKRQAVRDAARHHA